MELAVVAEPYRVLPLSSRIRSRRGTAVIVLRPDSRSSRISLIESGDHYVCVSWGKLIVIAAHASPTRPLDKLRDLLERLESMAARWPGRQVVVIGGFNAKSPRVGLSTGRHEGKRIARVDVVLVVRACQRDTVQTCCGRRVDRRLTCFANQRAHDLVNDREVLTHVETLSGHRYVAMRIYLSSGASVSLAGNACRRGWRLATLKPGEIDWAAVAAAWIGSDIIGGEDTDPEECSKRVDGALSSGDGKLPSAAGVLVDGGDLPNCDVLASSRGGGSSVPVADAFAVAVLAPRDGYLERYCEH